MRHLKHRNQLGVKKEHRVALTANLASALIREGRITTTLKKAKALRPFAEKMVTLAKKGTLHHRRLAISRIRDRDAVQILFNEKAQDFSNRNGGYTRIYKLGTRVGDAAEMAIIEWVAPDDEGYRKTRRKSGSKKAASTATTAAAAEEETPPAQEEEAKAPDDSGESVKEPSGESAEEAPSSEEEDSSGTGEKKSAE